MKRLLYRIFHKEQQYRHPNGYIIHSESRRFSKNGMLTNVCVWDGKQWHQAPLSMWDARDGINYLSIWIQAHLPLESFRHRND
jgi:hypothetical protein